MTDMPRDVAVQEASLFDADGIGNRETQQHISMQMTNFVRGQLQRFMSSNHFPDKYQQQSENNGEEEIELSLGLSLNGRFGVDPKATKLVRSSSIPDFINNPKSKDSQTGRVVPLPCAPLMRTCSLPVETEEEWRKRKELQTMRRMEAKRKRSEKQRNLKAARDRNRAVGEENYEEDRRDEQRVRTSNKPSGLPSWVNGHRTACGIEMKTERINGVRSFPGVDGRLPPAAGVAASQGSTGSQGSGSSGISELESQQAQGRNNCSDAKSPASVQSLPEGKQTPELTEASGKVAGGAMENQSNKQTVAEGKVKKSARNVLKDMPYVSTRGDGPNGKRIEGFLYQYRKGEEVRIVCVCHGNFLSPAEFIKHAGGGDVAHPLKHIVVNPSPLLWQ